MNECSPTKRTKTDHQNAREQHLPSTSHHLENTEPVIKIGTTDFAEIVKSSAFVDKTLLLRKIVYSGYCLLQISAPRRFGKSTNMNMIKRFIEIQVDIDGRPIADVRTTSNYKLFKENNLKICHSDHAKFFETHQGQHPVLYIDLNKLQDFHDYDDMLEKLKEVIHEAYTEHTYLLQNSRLFIDNDEKQRFEEMCDPVKIKALSHWAIPKALSHLAELLYTHFRRHVYILIDDYDASIVNIIFNENKEIDIKRCTSFIRSIISLLLKDNIRIGGGLANTSVRVAMPRNSEDASMPLTFFTPVPFLGEEELLNFYGFTEEEVQILLEKHNMSNKFSDVQLWYNGYTTPDTDVRIYNPWSVLHFLQEKVLQCYWVDLIKIRNLEELCLVDRIRKKMEIVLSNMPIFINKKERIRDEYVGYLRDLVNLPSTDTHQMAGDLFFQCLYYNGFFFALDPNCRNFLHLLVPNAEIHKFLASAVYTLSFYKRRFRFDDKTINIFTESLNLLKGSDPDTFVNFANSLADLFPDNVLSPNHECEFHNPIFLIVETKFSDVFGRKFIETGENCSFDLQIIRDDGTAIIIELKHNYRSAEDGLRQIFNGNYYKRLENNIKVTNEIIYVGLHFDQQRKITVCYLVNDRNIENAKTVCSN